MKISWVDRWLVTLLVLMIVTLGSLVVSCFEGGSVMELLLSLFLSVSAIPQLIQKTIELLK